MGWRGAPSRICKIGLAGEALSYSTIYPTPQTPSSLAWVQRTQAGCRPRSALRANQESFSFESGLLLDSKARLYSSELSYSYCMGPPHLSYTSDTILPRLGTAHASCPSGLRPLAITILQCAASRAAGGYDRPCELTKSLFLLNPARCLKVGP